MHYFSQNYVYFYVDYELINCLCKEAKASMLESIKPMNTKISVIGCRQVASQLAGNVIYSWTAQFISICPRIYTSNISNIYVKFML